MMNAAMTAASRTDVESMFKVAVSVLELREVTDVSVKRGEGVTRNVWLIMRLRVVVYRSTYVFLVASPMVNVTICVFCFMTTWTSVSILYKLISIDLR